MLPGERKGMGKKGRNSLFVLGALSIWLLAAAKAAETARLEGVYRRMLADGYTAGSSTPVTIDGKDGDDWLSGTSSGEAIFE